jgi:prepilin-type N-terminal cleavage/methylation domain-containing protein
MNAPIQPPSKPAARRGFSLVELLISVSIIGLIAFMAFPKVTSMRAEGEKNLAIARAEALNLAVANMIQVRGRSQAILDWAGKSDDQRYALVKDYLAFGETTLAGYLPSGYDIDFPNDLSRLTKVVLKDPTSTTIPY